MHTPLADDTSCKFFGDNAPPSFSSGIVNNPDRHRMIITECRQNALALNKKVFKALVFTLVDVIAMYNNSSLPFNESI